MTTGLNQNEKRNRRREKKITRTANGTRQDGKRRIQHAPGRRFGIVTEPYSSVQGTDPRKHDDREQEPKHRITPKFPRHATPRIRRPFTASYRRLENSPNCRDKGNPKKHRGNNSGCEKRQKENRGDRENG